MTDTLARNGQASRFSPSPYLVSAYFNFRDQKIFAYPLTMEKANNYAENLPDKTNLHRIVFPLRIRNTVFEIFQL